MTAHRIFLLHHGPSLQDLITKIKRERFCNTLERFWSRFCRDWEVLLHGNPAVDVFGGLKLSSGGELGVGVGEEEWGSGEREVLEDLTRRTEGLVDLTVSRFGETAEDEPVMEHPAPHISPQNRERTSWLGCGHLPEAHDGVIFGGIGAISRPALRDISAWVQQVYTYGEYAYGVRDNPHRQRTKRRKRNPPANRTAGSEPPQTANDKDLRKSVQKAEAQKLGTDDMPPLPPDPRPQMHDRVASHDHATGSPGTQVASHPGIPPPIVTAAEQALNKATSKADKSMAGEQKHDESAEPTPMISDRWMKYLTFGLSSGRSTPRNSQAKRPPAPRRTSTSSSKTLKPSISEDNTRPVKEPSIAEQDESSLDMKYVEPIPDGYTVAAQLAAQRQKENEGYFMIGYQGNLHEENSQRDKSQDDSIDEDDDNEQDRILLRTVQVATVSNDAGPKQGDRGRSRSASSSDTTSSARSSKIERLRVLVYVRRPFIYTFLFEQHASPLQLSALYKDLHRHLIPLHKPMVSNTSVARVSSRIAAAHDDDPQSIDTRNPPYDIPPVSPVFDLVYDPLLFTVHTSIPNIPLPGTLAAEGIGTTSSGRNGPPIWTRIEGLNVHSQILNTLESTKNITIETERTSKTTRGWWVVWMRIPPFSSANAATTTNNTDTTGSSGSSSSSTATDSNKQSTDEDEVSTIKSQSRDESGYGSKLRQRPQVADCRIAFLVRKANDSVAPAKSMSSRVSSGMFGFIGGNQTAAAAAETTVGSASGGGNTGSGGGGGPSSTLAGGIGIDARRYVESLLSLNR